MCKAFEKETCSTYKKVHTHTHIHVHMYPPLPLPWDYQHWLVLTGQRVLFGSLIVSEWWRCKRGKITLHFYSKWAIPPKTFVIHTMQQTQRKVLPYTSKISRCVIFALFADPSNPRKLSSRNFRIPYTWNSWSTKIVSTKCLEIAIHENCAPRKFRRIR